MHSSAAAKGDLANVVFLWGMAAAQGINPMQADDEVRFDAGLADC